MTLVDTDVLIAHLRGLPAARGWLAQERARGRLSVSAVSVTEVTGGMRSGERSDVRSLLDALTCLPVTCEVAERAGAYQRAYRRSHSGISLGDYLIAATVTTSGESLATLDVRRFPMVPDLVAPFAVGS